MMKIKHALLGLASLFCTASCTLKEGSGNGKPDHTTHTVDTLDYRVTAFSPKGDVMWRVITDDFEIKNDALDLDETKSISTPAGTRAIEKDTGHPYFAGPKTTVAVKPLKVF